MLSVKKLITWIIYNFVGMSISFFVSIFVETMYYKPIIPILQCRLIKLDCIGWFKNLIVKVDQKCGPKRLSRSDNGWLNKPWDKLWYEIILIRLDP